MDSSPVELYQFRVHLVQISPMIWRRIWVRSDHTVADLHYITQIMMNWSNYYLHRFTIRGKHYGISRGSHWYSHEAADFRLSDWGLRINERFLYEYSFFEWWQHQFRLEKKLPLVKSKTYPVCIAGARAAPPENCGGVDGFLTLQEHYSQGYIASRVLDFLCSVMDNEPMDHDDLERYRAEFTEFSYWVDAEKFDRRTVNQRLKWYAAQDERWAEGLEAL